MNRYDTNRLHAFRLNQNANYFLNNLCQYTLITEKPLKQKSMQNTQASFKLKLKSSLNILINERKEKLLSISKGYVRKS